MTTVTRHVKHGIYLSYFYLFLSFLFTFFLTPFILHCLNQSMYGLWAIFSSTLGYFMVFDLGMNVAIAKYTSEYLALNRLDSLSELISSVFVAFLAISLAVLLMSVGLIPFIPRIFNISPDVGRTAQIAFLIMAGNVVLSFVKGVFINFFYGSQRVDITKLFASGQLAVSAVLIVVFLKSGWGIIGLVSAVTASSLIFLIAAFLFFRQRRTGIRIHPRLASLKKLVEIFPYSIRNFILHVTNVIFYKTDLIVIGIFLNSAQAAPYDIAYKLVFYATYLFSEISSTLFPKFSKLYALGNLESLRRMNLTVTRVSIAITMPVIIFFVFLGRPFINRWVGPQNFVGQAVFALFIVLYFMHGLETPPFLLLQAIGKNRGATNSESARAVLNIILSIALVRRWGLFGVALGTILANTVTSLWYIPLSACRKIGLPVKTYLLSGVLPPVFMAIPVGIVTRMAVVRLLPGTTFPVLAVKGALITLMYFSIYLIFTPREEHKMLLSMLPVKWPAKGGTSRVDEGHMPKNN